MANAEGKKYNFDSIECIDTQVLETFKFDHVNQYIKSVTHEFSAVCPFSGLPDIAELIIEYYPQDKKCIELKSLKYYITSFRNVGLYQEGCTARIYTDLKNVLNTEKIKVTTIYNVRGGFTTTAIQGTLD